MTAVTADTPLSVQMREGSQAEHTAAEGSNFLEELLGGRVNRRGYADYLHRYLGIYRVLEELGREHSADGTVAAALIDPVLDREAPIARDLTYWSAGELDASTELVSPATDAYVARLQEIGSDPLKFVAHHYTRYLGDLSGGQVIGRMLTRAFETAAGEGVDFYEFPTIEKVKLYKDSYRSNLDSLDLTPEQQAVVVDEVKKAFALNQGLFDELAANLDAYRR